MNPAIFEEQLAAVLTRHPELRTPARPLPPAPRADGVTQQLSAAVVFDELREQLAAGPYRLRSPASGPDGLVGPFNSIGDCLSPIGEHSDLLWVDPAMPAQDGDLVLVQWRLRTLEGILRRGSSDYEWLKMYGSQPPPIATKLLKQCGRGYWLATRQSLLELGGNKILGVVRRIVRDGRSLYDAEPAPGIDENAATNAAVATFSSTVTATGNTGNYNAANGAVATTGPPFNCTAIVTIMVCAYQSAGTPGQILLECTYTDDGGLTYAYSAMQIPLTASVTPYALEWQFQHLASNAALVPHANLAFDNTGPSTNAVTYGPVTSQIEMIIR